MAGELECLEDHEKLERVEGIEPLLDGMVGGVCKCVNVCPSHPLLDNRLRAAASRSAHTHLVSIRLVTPILLS